MKQVKLWSERSPEEQEQIKLNREVGNDRSPYSGKNRAQRNNLIGGFIAMMPKRAAVTY